VEQAQRATADNSLKAICGEYLAREGRRLRSGEDRADTLERLVYPTLGKRSIGEVKRSDIIRLLDKIEDDRGPVMADMTLAYIRRVMNWHASRSDDFRSPIIRGMARTKPKERARQRILNDDELRAVWNAAGDGTAFGSMLRFILLMAARRDEVAKMRWDELSAGSD
jgi:integrase